MKKPLAKCSEVSLASYRMDMCIETSVDTHTQFWLELSLGLDFSVRVNQLCFVKKGKPCLIFTRKARARLCQR